MTDNFFKVRPTTKKKFLAVHNGGVDEVVTYPDEYQKKKSIIFKIWDMILVPGELLLIFQIA